MVTELSVDESKIIFSKKFYWRKVRRPSDVRIIRIIWMAERWIWKDSFTMNRNVGLVTLSMWKQLFLRQLSNLSLTKHIVCVKHPFWLDGRTRFFTTSGRKLQFATEVLNNCLRKLQYITWEWSLKFHFLVWL